MPTPTTQIAPTSTPRPWRCPMCRRLTLTDEDTFDHKHGHIPANVLRRHLANYPRLPGQLVVEMAFAHLQTPWHRDHEVMCCGSA